MGARSLRPVLTRRTQAARVNLERLAANAREACEQCGIIWRPECLADAVRTRSPDWPAERLLVFCDEDARRPTPLARSPRADAPASAFLIGPEGGFDDEERALIARAAADCCG